MTIKILDRKTPDALVVPFLQRDNLREQLADVASRSGIDVASLQADFTAEAREMLTLYAYNSPGRKIYLLGLGKKFQPADLSMAFRFFCSRFRNKLPMKLGVDLRQFPAEQLHLLTEAAINGMLLGVHDAGLYRQPDPEKPEPVFGSGKSVLEILVPTSFLSEAEAVARRSESLAIATLKIMDLVNTPGNYKTPAWLAEWAVAAAGEFGFKVSVMDPAALEKEGLKALLAVGQGSPNPPQLLLLEYGEQSGKQKKPVLGLVGKGVTYDSGGLSLKPSASMQYMKSDMGGAAAVLGAFMVVARQKVPIHLVGAIPLAENMIDGKAIKPGDVIGSYSGKTIEVTDTDAEGRLVLADAMAYLLSKEQPAVLIDLATLTGSVVRTLGAHAAGMFTQNDALAEALAEAGNTSGERVWRLPLWDEYGADLPSDVADLRNFTGKPVAEGISAAKFLEHFTSQHPAWAHLDIAGVAFGDSEFTKSKAATGWGIRLLLTYAERMAAFATNADGRAT